MEENDGDRTPLRHLPEIRYREKPWGPLWQWTPVRRTMSSRDCWRTYSYPNEVVLAINDDWKWLSEEIRVVREDNLGLSANVDVQTARVHELETDVLEERKKVETLREQFQEVKRQLVRVVHEVRDRIEGMMAECITKILDDGHEVGTPSAEDENIPIEIAETSGSANH